MKHSDIIAKYYAGLMSQFNAPVLNEILKKLPVAPEDESIICTSFVKIMSLLSATQIENKEYPDLRGFRLDWCRLQAYTSVAKASLNLKENEQFAKFMNTFYFHSQLIDDHHKLLGKHCYLVIYQSFGRGRYRIYF